MPDVNDLRLQNNGGQPAIQHRPERDPARHRRPLLVRSLLSIQTVSSLITRGDCGCCRRPQVQGNHEQHGGPQDDGAGPAAGAPLQPRRGPEDRAGGPAGARRPGPGYVPADHDQVVGHSRFVRRRRRKAGF